MKIRAGLLCVPIGLTTTMAVAQQPAAKKPAKPRPALMVEPTAADEAVEAESQELDPQSTARQELTIFEFRDGFVKYTKLNGAAAVIQQSQIKRK